jgi:hypothetical protein
MNGFIKKYFIAVLVLVTGLFFLDAYAAKPVKITVTEAIPGEALQGDGLPVRIKGTGFGHGSTARFLVTGTQDDSQIVVGTVTYEESSGDLIADIQVKDQALVIEYDIEVQTASGRRGKGTTMFRVRQRGEDDPCVAMTSYFPAFAYCVMYESGQDLGFDIFVASADGSCTVPIYSVNAAFRCDISFRYYENSDGTGTGKIVWAQSNEGPDTSTLPTIRMLEFNVANNEITDPLPLNSKVMYTGPYSYPRGGTYDAELDPQGGKVLFHQYDNPDTGYEIHSLNELDISDCTGPDCITRLVQFEPNARHANYAEYSLEYERIYFLLSNYDIDYVKQFAFVDKQGETWSEPTIVDSYDLNAIALDVGLWDWDGDGVAEEVVAVSIDQNRTEFTQIWGCLFPGEEPCLVLDSIESKRGSFKSIDGFPVFLHLSRGSKNKRTGPAILEYDLSSGEIRHLIDAIPGGPDVLIGSVDAAD